MVRNTGPYFAYETLDDEVSLSFSIGLHTLEDNTKDFQISIVIFDMAIAVGWTF